MLTLNQSSLDVSLVSSAPSQFHYAWLRDNCRCCECVHPDIEERLLVTATIADDIAPVNASIENESLMIEWNQGHHQSRYPFTWLKQHDYTHQVFETDLAKAEIKLWGQEFEASIPEFSYQHIRNNEDALLEWCCALRDYGLTIVRDAPLVEGEIERFAEFVAVVRETIYDRLHDVRATPNEYNAYNVASTTLELKPHTDMPNYNSPPSVQMFHFMMNESIGGESTAVDGFNVAQQIKQSDPAAYDVLAKTPIHFKIFSDKGDIQANNPAFTLDAVGELKVFRYSNQSAQPINLAPDQMDEFYHAYRLLGRTVEAPANKVQIRLNTGDIMVTDNLRVMHGRNAYDSSTGARHLQLSYMDMDDVMSRIRMVLKSR